MTKKKLKLKRVDSENMKDKSTKRDVSDGKSDRISFNLSYQPMDGVWVAFGYESDVRPGEELEEAKTRVWDEVVETVTEKSKQFTDGDED